MLEILKTQGVGYARIHQNDVQLLSDYLKNEDLSKLCFAVTADGEVRFEDMSEPRGTAQVTFKKIDTLLDEYIKMQEDVVYIKNKLLFLTRS